MNDQRFPEPIVGVFILNKKNELLLIESHKWKGLHIIPGGHVELGESLEDAVRRETLEETGLHILKPEFLCVHEYLNDGAFHKPRHFIFLEYKATAESTEVTLNEEGHAYRWTALEEALTLPTTDSVRSVIRQYLLPKTS
ncbi:MAG TPA: NUDIX domain-containing protein [Candidatus Saccharimonadales bacterium]|nr:NUDIX domain-containing protein [Candidatus Saccharimonadales bacterium]